ncbi:TetR/AcrR family transcriptional regulator C-terminal domain-containing protein [Amycolatopsis sp. cg5]|uniref:TetR/AcrR family transcriptional regulator C-terminal domain-containing protein n=1 Tax=Amycolatopsis sp. cg5 TaxID=3238802 RepID=UPI0035247F91
MGRKPQLDQHQITQAAVELLDEAGLTELTTRRLATKLGVQSPTLYWHVKNKDELLDLVAEAICADAFTIDETLPWCAQLASGLRQFRALLRTHRDAAALLRERPPTGPHRRAHVETTHRILRDAGFTEHDTQGIARLLAAHMLNTTADDTDDTYFELGIEIILDGLTQRAKRRPSNPAPSTPHAADPAGP